VFISTNEDKSKVEQAKQAYKKENYTKLNTLIGEMIKQSIQVEEREEFQVIHNLKEKDMIAAFEKADPSIEVLQLLTLIVDMCRLHNNAQVGII